MRRIVLLLVAVGVVFAGVVGSALGASSVFLCVSSTAGGAVTSGGTTGTCGSGTSAVALPAEKTEQEKLISILPHINYEASGIDEKPTVQFSGINLQVIDGSGSESTVNGTGNLILGYDEKPGTQTGSHDLLLGGYTNSFTSYGATVGGGHNNRSAGPYASVLGGAENTASGTSSAVFGGYGNQATANDSSIAGGCSNLTGKGTTILNSQCTNTALAGDFQSVSGGAGNQAEAQNSTVSGGLDGEASGVDASVTGGSHGKASYRASTVLGGLEEVTHEEFEVTP
jgi:hypothetical protein